jgi:hypothetical protein
MIFRFQLSLLFFLIFSVVHAQVKLAMYAGPQITNVVYKVREAVQPTEQMNAVMGGLSLKVPFEKNLYFFPSAYYSRKSFKVDLKDGAYPPSEKAINNEMDLHTIEFAPLLQLDFSKKPTHLFIRFGPAFDFAFGGRETFDTLNTTGSTGSVSRDVNFSFTAYGRYTTSLNGHLGFQSGAGFMIFAHYAHGLGSRNNGDYGPRIIHRTGGISLGWLFNSKRKS